MKTSLYTDMKKGINLKKKYQPKSIRYLNKAAIFVSEIKYLISNSLSLNKFRFLFNIIADMLFKMLLYKIRNALFTSFVIDTNNGYL